VVLGGGQFLMSEVSLYCMRGEESACMVFPMPSGPDSKPETRKHAEASLCGREREFLIGNLLVRIHCIIVMITWTGLAPWEFEFLFSGSLTCTFLASRRVLLYARGGECLHDIADAL
jgi:hypothetical protein